MCGLGTAARAPQRPVEPLFSGAQCAFGHRRQVHLRDADGVSISAAEWLLEVMTKPELANQRKIFRVRHPKMAGKLGATTEGLK